MAEHPQAIEGYGCICGFTTRNKKEMTTHLMVGGRHDGKGIHKSKGRINTQSGEVIMPPYDERNDEQKSESIYAANNPRSKKSDGDKGNIPPGVKTTDILANASRLNFITRVYTTDYSPIMRAAQDAAIEYWKWPADMSLGDFLDTALHLLFFEHGIKLAGHSISDEARKALEFELKSKNQGGS